MAPRAVAPALIAMAMAVLSIAVPWSSPVVAADALALAPSADAWLNRQRPDSNYGSMASLRAAGGNSESVIRFNVTSWLGLPVAGIALTLAGIDGNATGLFLGETTTGWRESSVTWRSRPSTVGELARPPVIDGRSARFDVATLFPSGVIDRNSVSIRVRNANTTVATFGSRESSTKPRLSLTMGEQARASGLTAIADTWADSTAPSRTHPSGSWLFVDGQSKAEAYLMFDLSGWQGQAYVGMDLQLQIRNGGGAGVLSVYRVGTRWSETNLTWTSRPAGGLLLTQVAAPIDTGRLSVDLGSAFATGVIDRSRLAVRIVSSSSRGFDFSSREGSLPPQLLVSAEPTPTPTPVPTDTPTPVPTPIPTPTQPETPTPTPTASASETPFPSPSEPPPSDPPPTVLPTDQPTSSPCPSPAITASPEPSPIATVEPSPTPCPTAAPTPSPEPLFYFSGFGTDHGVGMSQQGARGRAAAGQTYEQILTFYYTGVEFSTIDGTTPVRVLLSDAFWPSTVKPARITGLVGGWQSAAFPGLVFPAGSYVEMWPSMPIPLPTPTPDPTPTPTPDANASPTPSPDISPTPTPDVSPTPTADASPSPTPDPLPTPTPDPGMWFAVVYDSVGTLIATTTTADLLVEAAEADGVLEMRYRDEVPKYKTYRGGMRLLVTSTGLQTVNVLPMESYLRGVVPAEVPATWPIEAVKSQAVAARTYAWARLKPSRTWDVVPTAANQVYGGYQHEHPRSDEAVAATQNLVLTYAGKVISALYHASAGGHTENSEYAFVNDRGDVGNRIAYLRGKPDVDEIGVPYDSTAGTYAWQSDQFTMAQLSAMLSRNPLTDVGDIYNITYWRGVSGRVYRVLLEGSGGSKTVSGGKFKNTYNDYKLSGRNAKSTLFYLTPVTP